MAGKFTDQSVKSTTIPFPPFPPGKLLFLFATYTSFLLNLIIFHQIVTFF
jgi:hypothetical protein